MQQIGDQRGALLLAEKIVSAQSFVQSGHYGRALLLRQLLRLSRHHVGQTHHGRHQSVVIGVDARIRQRLVELTHVFAEHIFVDGGRRVHRRALHRYAHVRLAALYGAARHAAYVVFERTVERGELDGEVQLFGIERPYLHGYLFGRQSDLALAESCHGFNHCGNCSNRAQIYKKSDAEANEVRFCRNEASKKRKKHLFFQNISGGRRQYFVFAVRLCFLR